jgi:ParB/RepB/Spo0J family partition protein
MDETGSSGTGPAPRSVPLAELSTSLLRARCLRPPQVERMRQSLARHGQLTPIVVVARQGRLEVVDGFKRRAAAAAMQWPAIVVSERTFDEQGIWVAMLMLNRGPGSMTVLEEALILREMVLGGATQVAIAELMGRHPSWVSRRIGLVDRLHPELTEWVRTGLMPPGTARRLIVLPAGNQLEVAAVVAQAALGTEQTEALVSLWQKASDPQTRRTILSRPREALAEADPCARATDPRLSPRGQALERALHILQGLGPRVMQGLRPPPRSEDLAILRPDLLSVHRMLPGLKEAVGTASRSPCCDARSATSETASSAACSPTDRASRPPPRRPA